MEHSQKIGLLGEIYASRYLRDKGYNILAANFTSKTGEIDIVAEKEGVCIFTEVKARADSALLPPAEAVDYQKQERLKSTAAAYLTAQKIKSEIRFDIIEVLFSGTDYTVNHIKNAF